MDTIRIAKGQDAVIEIIVRAGWDEGEVESVRLSAYAAAAATSLSIEPLKYALDSGDMLMFPGNLVATLGDAGAIGATTLTVTALPGPIRQGVVGEKLRDLTGYTIALEILNSAEDTTPALTQIAGTNQTQSAITGRGRVQFAIAAAASGAAEARRYYAAARKTDSGSVRPQWEGEVEIYAGGFLN